MQYRALFVPEDSRREIEVVTVEDSSEVLARLIFEEKYPERSELGFSSFRHIGAQSFFDDLGLYREDNGFNRRAMELWAKLVGVSPDAIGPLRGNHAWLGMDEAGETRDVPQDIVTMAGLQVTWQLCPQSPDGGTHHLTPQRVGAEHNVLACRWCGATEAELRGEA